MKYLCWLSLFSIVGCLSMGVWSSDWLVYNKWFVQALIMVGPSYGLVAFGSIYGFRKRGE